MEELLQAHNQLTELHILTKTTDHLFHTASEKWYEDSFDVFHTIAEKRQDIGEDKSMDCHTAAKEALPILEKVRDTLDKMIKENKDVGMDNLLRSHYDKIEFDIGTAKSFIYEDKEE